MNTMNERLREFERASGLEIYGLGAKRVPWEAAMERFAELIVQECMEQVHYTREDVINGNISEVIKERMKQHFGVK